MQGHEANPAGEAASVEAEAVAEDATAMATGREVLTQQHRSSRKACARMLEATTLRVLPRER